MTDAQSNDGVAADGTTAPGFAAAPSRASIATVVVLSVAFAAVSIGLVGPALAIVLAFAHAVTFAASLWLVNRERWPVVASASAGLLALVVGASFAAAVGYTALDLIAALYPVSSLEQVRPRGLHVASATAVVLGGTVGMVGALATVGGRLDPETAWAYAKLAVETFVVPLLVAAVLLVSTLLRRLGGETTAPLVDPAVDAIGTVIAPVPGRTHLFTFCLVFAVACAAVAQAVDALPVAELSTRRTDTRIERTAGMIEGVTRRLAVVTTVVVPLTVVEVVASPANLRAVLTPPVYGFLAGITASPLLRLLFVSTAVLAGGTAGVVWSLKRMARADSSDVAVAVMPLVGGVAVATLAAGLHGVILSPTLAFVADALPGQFATAFTQQSTAVVDYYGSLAVVVTVAAALVGTTAALSFALALLLTAGALPESAPGPALAAAGTFVAAGFGAGAGIGAPVVLAGVVASIVVWDAGEFGATLGREVGRTGTSLSPQLVHVTATLAVGVLGALGALAIYRVATGTVLTDVTTIPFALSVVVVALVLLVAALR